MPGKMIQLTICLCIITFSFPMPTVMALFQMHV